MSSEIFIQIATACITFAVTNIDDLLILSVYFANSEYKTRNIVVGQYLGIISLTAISLLTLLFGKVIEAQWISLLGILPLSIGIKALLVLRKNGSTDDELPQQKSHYQFLSVALVTIANGGDNLGVYGPLFANLSTQYLYVYVIVFLFLTAVWCLTANYLVKHPRIRNIFSKYGKIILPAFLMVLGLIILKKFFVWAIVAV